MDSPLAMLDCKTRSYLGNYGFNKCNSLWMATGLAPSRDQGRRSSCPVGAQITLDGACGKTPDFRRA